VVAEGNQVLVAEMAVEVQVMCWRLSVGADSDCLRCQSLVHDPWIQILHVDLLHLVLETHLAPERLSHLDLHELSCLDL